MIQGEKRDYKSQILEFLAHDDVMGFNTLKKMGNFHPNRLKAHLVELEKEGQVSIDRTNKIHVYSYITPKIDEKYATKIKDLKQIENSLKAPDLKPVERTLLLSNYLKLAFHKYDLLRILSLWPQGPELTSKQIRIMKIFQEKLFKDIKKKLEELDDLERAKVLNVLVSNYSNKPYLMSLQSYREYTHKPTSEEKRQEKLRLEKEKEKVFLDSPYCIFCGFKPANYKEVDKHEEQHANNFQKNTIESVKSFKGFYCPVCGKNVGSMDKIDKHNCKLKRK